MADDTKPPTGLLGSFYPQTPTVKPPNRIRIGSIEYYVWLNSLRPKVAKDGSVKTPFETVYPNSMSELLDLLKGEREHVVINRKHGLSPDAWRIAAVAYHDGVLWLNKFSDREAIQPWGLPVEDETALEKLKGLIDTVAAEVERPSPPSKTPGRPPKVVDRDERRIREVYAECESIKGTVDRLNLQKRYNLTPSERVQRIVDKVKKAKSRRSKTA